MSLGVIPAADVGRTWFLCEPMLAKAMKNGECAYTLPEIKDGCERGVFHLWAWVEDKQIACCGVTHIQDFPSRKICSLMLVGGGKLRSWLKPAFEIMAEWAKRNGCSDMEGYARKGWLRVLPEWRQCWITIRRSL